MSNRILTYAQAIAEALVLGLKRDPKAFIFGLGVDDYKGIFGTTQEAAKVFGSSRVFDVPAAEGALTGIAIGTALNGYHPVLVHARNDFMFLALDQMLNNAAKWAYTYNGQTRLPLIIRGIVGQGWGQGPTHSQNLQSILAHFPGLIVASPSDAVQVKGVLLKAFETQSPVVMIEHRALYEEKKIVPEGWYTVDFGKAVCVREGKDVTIVATSVMAHMASLAADVLAQEGISVEVIDPVTVQPLDEQGILASVAKTGRLICCEPGWLNCSVSSEVAAMVAQKGFYDLKAPIQRIGWPFCPLPVSKELEQAFYPNQKTIMQAVYQILGIQKELKEYTVAAKESFKGPY